MAKKKITKKQKVKTDSAKSERTLPQNIVVFGEHVEEDKNIYISQPVYKEIHKFTKDKTVNESGGVLLGNVIEEFGKTNIVIYSFIEAKYCEGTPTTLKFTHESWEYIHKQAEKKYPQYKILGWIHTHPDFGIFLSEYDKFIQENFFKEENQIAYVIDPIQKIEGFYFWINGKIERCKGFFVFDKTGTRITVSDKKEEETVAPSSSPSLIRDIITGIVALIAVILLFTCINMNKKIKKLQSQQEALVSSANQSFSNMQQMINVMYEEMESLKSSHTLFNNDTKENLSDDTEKNADEQTEAVSQEAVQSSVPAETSVPENNVEETNEPDN